MNQVADKNQKHNRFVKLRLAAAAAASFGMATATPRCGRLTKRTQGFPAARAAE